MPVEARAVTANRAGFDARKWGGWILGVGIWILPLWWIDLTTYLTLTIAGVTMGALLFLTASGLTVIFGLMDVLNLTHGAFFAWGAYAGFTLLNYLDRLGWIETATMGQSLGDLAAGFAAGPVGGSGAGAHPGKDHHPKDLRESPQTDPDYHGRGTGDG